MKLIAKTLQGLEDVLADELRALGADNVEPGRRMVSYEGDMRMLYLSNMALRTALRVLMPIATFEARDADLLYDRVKEMDWGELMTPKSTFMIDAVVYSSEFTDSRYVTYRVKDAIVDWFQDRLGAGIRPGVRVQEADLKINVHIAGTTVTVSLDSSGESLHHRGWRVAGGEAPLNEVLAAGILLKSGWKGDTPLVDPMCGSGTFLIEGAMIAAGIMPGIYRRGFAFESWPDFDADLLESIYNDDSGERTPAAPIIGADISAGAIEAARRNIASAALGKYITLERRALASWEEAPEGGVPGVLVTNPPYGERIKVDNIEGLYETLGKRLKFVFRGYHAWVIAPANALLNAIGLAPSVKEDIYNGQIECQLREYVTFDGDYRTFRSKGGTLGKPERNEERPAKRSAPRKPRPTPRREEGEPENPLRAKRNPHALKSIAGKRPTLPPSGTIMRPRKGWRKKDEE